VLRAAGRLSEDFRPAPDGFIATRARQVLSEAVELLERICDDTLLRAIADGTFGLMKRPPHGGRGYDGVFAHAAGYYNPASELLGHDAMSTKDPQPVRG
jgi:beta-lysine 5,6-aminomutase alpha subunit